MGTGAGAEQRNLQDRAVTLAKTPPVTAAHGSEPNIVADAHHAVRGLLFGREGWAADPPRGGSVAGAGRAFAPPRAWRPATQAGRIRLDDLTQRAVVVARR